MTQKKEKLIHRNSMISVLYNMYQRKPIWKKAQMKTKHLYSLDNTLHFSWEQMGKQRLWKWIVSEWRSVERWMAGAVDSNTMGYMLQHQCREHGSPSYKFCTFPMTCTNPYYSFQQTEFVYILVTMLTTLEDPMCKCSSWYQWLSVLLNEAKLTFCMTDAPVWLFSIWIGTLHLIIQLSLYRVMCSAAMLTITVLWSYTLFNHGVVMLWGYLDPRVQMIGSTIKASKCKLT